MGDVSEESNSQPKRYDVPWWGRITRIRQAVDRLIENCRLVGADPETHLINLIARLPPQKSASTNGTPPGQLALGRGSAPAAEPSPEQGAL